MRKYLKYFLISLFLLVFVFLALPYLAALWVCRIEGDVVCFGGVAEVTGSVWGPCNYTGAVEIVDGPPIEWQYSGGFKCIGAGHAGGRTYAVFIRVVGADATGEPFKSEIERDLCFCAKERIVPCIFVTKPAVLLTRVGIFVVDVKEGVGYLSIVYTFKFLPEPFNYSYFIFGGDGVYLVDGLVAEMGAKREIMGPLLKGCAYRVKIRLEPEKLTISQPLYNITTRAVKVG